MRIHLLQTGSVIVKAAQLVGQSGGHPLVHILRDRRWTSPLPIFAFLIEHPEGLIVVDTGGDGPGGRARLLPALAPLLPLWRARPGAPRGGDRPPAPEPGLQP